MFSLRLKADWLSETIVTGQKMCSSTITELYMAGFRGTPYHQDMNMSIVFAQDLKDSWDETRSSPRASRKEVLVRVTFQYLILLPTTAALVYSGINLWAAAACNLCYQTATSFTWDHYADRRRRRKAGQDIPFDRVEVWWWTRQLKRMIK